MKTTRIQCNVCKGSGSVRCPLCQNGRTLGIRCASCKGTGKTRCFNCEGKGYTQLQIAEPLPTISRSSSPGNARRYQQVIDPPLNISPSPLAQVQQEVQTDTSASTGLATPAPVHRTLSEGEWAVVLGGLTLALLFWAFGVAKSVVALEAFLVFGVWSGRRFDKAFRQDHGTDAAWLLEGAATAFGLLSGALALYVVLDTPAGDRLTAWVTGSIPALLTSLFGSLLSLRVLEDLWRYAWKAMRERFGIE